MSDAAPTESAAEWVPVEQLRPWRDNPRKNDAAVDDVADSIKRFGFGAPILARRFDGEVIAGHTRLKAALKLGLRKVPVRFVDLDPVEAHLLALADNKTSEISEWDEPMLGAVLAEMKRADVELLTGTGFNESEIAQLTRDVELPAGESEDLADFPEAASEAVFFKFGEYSGQLSRDVYDSFVKQYTAKQRETGEPLMDDVMRAWLNV